MENESKKMIKLTELAKAHLDNEEEVKFKVLGMLDGKFEGKWIVHNGIFLATNKRLFFYNKKHTTTIEYSDISNVEYIEKKLNSPTIKFRHNNEEVSIKYIDQGDIQGFYGFLKSKETDQPEDVIVDSKSENGIREGYEKKEEIKEVTSVSKEKKPIHKRWWFWVVAAIFVFGAIGNMTEDGSDAEETVASPDEEQVAEEKVIDSDEPIEEVVENEEENNAAEEDEVDIADEKKEKEEVEKSIDEAIVEDNNYVDEATFSDGKLTLIADGKTTFSENTLFYSVYDLFEAMHEGFQDESVNEVYVELLTTMIDPKGNESVEPVIKYNYSRESFEELNYENFANMAYSEQWRILREADYYYIHPGIYKNLKDKYKDNLSVEGFKE